MQNTQFPNVILFHKQRADRVYGVGQKDAFKSVSKDFG